MRGLTDKSYKTYNRLSRYSIFPYYFDVFNDKFVYSTTAQLSDKTVYSNYVVKRNDTYDSIALEMYNNPTYYWIICDFNRISDPFVKPKEGTILKIPTVSTISYNIQGER